MMFLLITIAVLIVWSLSWRLLFKPSKATNIPGPATWPIIGNAYYFMGVNSVERALQAFTKMTKAYDAPLSRIWLGPKLVVLVKSPTYIQALLTHKSATTKDGFLYEAIKAVTTNGVFTRKGEEWQRMRRPMASLLLPKNIQNFQGIICRKVGGLCQELEIKNYSESFDISPYIQLCSLEIICEAGMGTNNLEFLGEEKYGFCHLIAEEVENVFLSIWSFQTLLGLKKYNPKKIHERAGSILSKLIDKRKMEIESQGMNYMTDDPENYIDVVLRTAEIEQLNKHKTSLLLVDFIVAGSDTMNIAVIVSLYLLAMHQEYQEKVYQELVNIFGHSDRNPTEDDLRQMVYLEMCVKEALRHCCPPAVARTADEDIVIDGYIIPDGAMLLFTLYLTLEDPQYWERPGDFYPDHFQAEAVAKRPKGTYLPFVAGPKMCPGQLYSFQAMKTIVSTLLRRFHFTTDQKYSDLKYKYLLMREPVNPLVKLSRRQPPTNCSPVQSSINA